MTGSTRRDRLAALAVTAVAFAAGVAVAASGARIMPSYLAAWLFLLALPLGALAIVMALELAGAAASLVVPPLRRMLVLLPVAAVFVVPVLLRVDLLYAWSTNAPAGFAAEWFRRSFFIGRVIVYLALWCGLAAIFVRPPPMRAARGRKGWAAFGLLLHAVIATLAAIDCAMSVHLALGSSAFGILLIAAQCAAAIAAAAVLTGRDRLAGRAASAFAVTMGAITGAWAYMQFIQFLVIWSADLPAEAVWYLHRSAGLGAAAEWLGLLALAAALALCLPRRARPTAVLAVAVLSLLTHLIEMFWLITPSFRGRFTITPADLLCMIVVVLVAGSLLAAFRPAPSADMLHHAAA